jgi:hypothetical protein
MDEECTCLVAVVTHEANMMIMMMIMVLMKMNIRIVANHIKKRI